MGRAISVGAAVGLLFSAVTLAVAAVYTFWIAPQGGDGWDAAHFFTHAFPVLFAIGFIPSFAWQVCTETARWPNFPKTRLSRNMERVPLLFRATVT